MNSTRLKFELIDPQTADRVVSPLAQLSSRLRREEPAQPRSQARPRLVQDLAQGLDFLMAQLSDAETERDRAKAEADRWKSETGKMRTEIADLQREVKAAAQGSAEVQATRQTLEGVVAEQQKALLLSMELMQRFEGEMASLRSRIEAMEAAEAAAPAAVVAVPDETLRELEELRAKQEQYAAEKQSNEELSKSLANRLEAALQENAALTTANHELQKSLTELNGALQAAKELNQGADEATAKATEAHRTELAAIQAKLTAALEEAAQLREELAEQTKLGDLTSAIRALEEQRDIARNEAASARADVSIQSAEIETKDALISALERALEQQHGSLRNLEQRFADYATRLQELRLDRLRMPKGAESRLLPSDEGAYGFRKLLDGFKRTFSPTPKPPVEPTEESE